MNRFVPLAAATFALAVGFSGTASALTVTNHGNAPDSWALAMDATADTLNKPGEWQLVPLATPSTRYGNDSGIYRSVFDGEGVTDGADAGWDKKGYWAVGPGNPVNPAIMKFEIDQTSLSFLWGSVDDYNTLKFFLNGVEVGSLGGVVGTLPVPGAQARLGASYVTIKDVVFDELRFGADTNAFEFSNMTTTPVPIPAAAWLLGSGLLGLFGLARRKKISAA